MEATIAAPPKQQFPLWRRLWFRHPFRFEANLSPEEYAEAIYKYDWKPVFFWNADGIFVELGVKSTNAIPFTITMYRSPRYNYYIHSRAKGEISVDPLSGRTIVTGRVSFYWHLGVVFFFCGMTLGLVVGLVKEPCILIFCLAAFAYALIMPHVDRAALMDLLEKTAISGYITQSYELSKTQRKKQKKIIHKSQKKKK